MNNINFLNLLFNDIPINITDDKLINLYKLISKKYTSLDAKIKSSNKKCTIDITQIVWGSTEILEDIIKHYDNMICYQIRDLNTDIKFNFYLPNNLSNKDKEYIQDNIKYILLCRIVLLNLNNIFTSTYNDKYEINFYLSGLKKIIDYNNKVFTVNEVNSGESNIHLTKIFRMEESIKVAFHETSHSLGVFRNDVINKYFAIKDNKIAIAEVVVEVIAVIFNSFVDTNNYEEFIKNIKIEILFGLLQSSKVLYKAGMNLNQFLNRNCDVQIMQNTAAVEYHILKTYVLYHINEFVDALYNSTSMSDLYTATLDIVLGLKTEKRDNKWFFDGINIGMNFIKENINTTDPIKKELINTFRMTITEPRQKIQKGGVRPKRYKLVKKKTLCYNFEH